MAYAQSSNILVFPTTKRGDNQRSARLLSEQSLVSIINQLVDEQAFVISKEYSTGEFQFNINGYYFKVLNMGAIISAVGSSANEVWANISMTETSAGPDNFIELDGQDDGGEYKGVVFTSSAQSSADFSLKLLSKVNNIWTIPRESQIRFDANTVFGDLTVDGGVIA